MNYLAHLFFADNNPQSLIGNLLADFIKGKQHLHLPTAVKNGVLLHRKIDKFTDQHAVVRQSQLRIKTIRAIFSGVVVDVFYDHFLARYWSHYSNLTLDEQVQQWSNTLARVPIKDYDFAPAKFFGLLERISNESLLQSYQYKHGIAKVLKRISQRISRDNNLDLAIADLDKSYQALERDFRDFFPDLIKYVHQVKLSPAYN